MAIVSSGGSASLASDSLAPWLDLAVHEGHPLGRRHSFVAPWKSIRRIRVAEVAQAAIGVAAITVLGISLRGHWGLFDVQPHPLWLLVAVIAIVHGSPAGYVAGLLAACSYAGLLWLRPDSASTPLPAVALVQPVALFLAGALTGEAISAVRGRMVEAQRRYGQVFGLWRTFYGRHLKTVQVNAELERRLLAHWASKTRLCESARRLQTLHTEDPYTGILEFVAALLDVRRASLYLALDGVLRLRAGLPSELPGRPSRLSLDSGPAAEACTLRDVVTVPDFRLGNGTAGEDEVALLVGPLLGEDGRPLGAVVVESFPLPELSQAAALCFKQGLSWASLALQAVAVPEYVENGGTTRRAETTDHDRMSLTEERCVV